MCGASIPPGLLRELELRADQPDAVDGLRRRLRDDAVRRPAGQRRARHPLLHAQPLALDAGDPAAPALPRALAARRQRLAPAAAAGLGGVELAVGDLEQLHHLGAVGRRHGHADGDAERRLAGHELDRQAVLRRPRRSRRRCGGPPPRPRAPRRRTRRRRAGPATPWRASTRATSVRTRSPARWPWVSLTDLKPSTSQISSAPCVPAASSRRTVSIQERRLCRPVRSSVWATASRRPTASARSPVAPAGATPAFSATSSSSSAPGAEPLERDAEQRAVRVAAGDQVRERRRRPATQAASSDGQARPVGPPWW